MKRDYAAERSALEEAEKKRRTRRLDRLRAEQRAASERAKGKNEAEFKARTKRQHNKFAKRIERESARDLRRVLQKQKAKGRG